MRLVRFEDESGGFSVDFHPLITVVGGLPAHMRERLINCVEAIPQGSDPGGRGTIEVHGVLLDLNRESLELLELETDLDVVVRAMDLPTAVGSGPDFGAEHLDDVALERARIAAEEAEREYEAVISAVSKYRSKLEELAGEHERLERELRATEAALDPDAESELIAALDAVAAARAAALSATRADAGDPRVAAASDQHSTPHDPAPAPDPAPPVEFVAPVEQPAVQPQEESPLVQLEQLELRLSESIERSNDLRQQLRALRALDPEPVQVAYDALIPLLHLAEADDEATGSADDAGAGAGLVGEAPDQAGTAAGQPELLAVDEEFSAIESILDRWQEISEAFDDDDVALKPPVDLGHLRADRDVAVEAVSLAEASVQEHRASEKLVAELERTHDQIFELDGKSPRIGATKHRRQLEALRETEAKLLEELGFASWSAYVMGVSSNALTSASSPGDDAGQRIVAAARARLVEIDNAIAEAEQDNARRDAALESRQHRGQRRQRLIEDTATLLGAQQLDHSDAALVDGLLARRSELIAERKAIASDADAGAGSGSGAPAGADGDAPGVESGSADSAASTADSTASADSEELATATENLRWALTTTGAELPDSDLAAEQMGAIAAGWLDAMAGLNDRIGELADERVSLEAEIEEMGARYESLLARVDSGDPSDSGEAPSVAVDHEIPDTADLGVATGFDAAPDLDAPTGLDVPTGFGDPTDLDVPTGFGDPTGLDVGESAGGGDEGFGVVGTFGDSFGDSFSDSFADGAEPLPTEPVPNEPVPNDPLLDGPTDDDPVVIAAKRRLGAAQARAQAHRGAAQAYAQAVERRERLAQRTNDVSFSLSEREQRVAAVLEQRAGAHDELQRLESALRETPQIAHAVGGAGVDDDSASETLEWYILARLAQQRSVSFVGSVPIVIDDAFAQWPMHQISEVYTRLERMGDVIQIIMLTDDPAVADWAGGLGESRALVIDPRLSPAHH